MIPGVPFVTVPELVLVPAGSLGGGSAALSIKPFGVLVATGVFIGSWLALRYGIRRGLSSKALTSFVFSVVAAGFVGAHVFDVLLYSPARLRSDPFVLLRLWDGLSSLGGFAGGALGAWFWAVWNRQRALPYADVVASSLPLGWLFGRAGCALVHDHPGVSSEAWIAVQYPDGARLDLGLLELGLVAPIALVFLLCQKRAWPWGFFVAVLSICYAPVRFFLDFWRIREPARILGELVMPDARYFALTPAQWACLGLALFGAVLLARVLSARGSAAAYAPELASDPDAQSGWSDSRAER